MEELDSLTAVDVMYVAELDPPTADGAQVWDIGQEKEKEIQLQAVKIGPSAAEPTTKSHSFVFNDLDTTQEKYNVIIRTLVNGRTIVSVSI